VPALKPVTRPAAAPATALKDPAKLPAGFQAVAESGPLRLAMDQTGARLIVEDRRSGMLWQSTPDGADQEQTGDNWKAILKSTVKVGTTDTKIKSTVRPGAAVAKQLTKVDGGAKVHYAVDGQAIEFDVLYTLTDGALNVKVPEASISEGKDFMLVYIEPLPFLGAARDGVPGYVLIPDGSGALMRFTPKVNTNLGFEEWAYGLDRTLATPAQNRQPVIAPVFGLARDSSAYLAVVTEGDYSAKITAMPSGNIVKYNRASAQLYYRNEYRAKVTDQKDVIQITTIRVAGDRSVRYTFLDGADANYSGMAKTYRDYLKYDRGVAAKPLKDGYPMSLRLFMGALEDGLVSDKLRTVTTFEQAQAVAEAFQKAGAAKLELTLVGWEQSGYHGDLPVRFPADSDFGGNSGLKRLLDWTAKANVPLYLQDDFAEAYKTKAGFTARSAGVESPIGIVSEIKQPRLSLPDVPSDLPPHWLINPTYVADRYFGSALPQFKSLGAKGLEFEFLGEGLYSDFKPSRAMDRGQTMATWLKMLAAARTELGAVSVQQGNAYTLGYVDRISDLPLDSSHYVYADESVPFMPMVLHGLVPYTDSEGNLRENARLEFLRQVEYGAMPTWELTYNSPADLRSTVYNKLYSAQYTDWLKQATEEYKTVQEKLSPLAGQFMTGHEYLTPDVAQVTYADGTRVVVNYGGSVYAANGVNVGARDFAVIKGGGAR
jgi:hypothetical protein